MKDVLQYLDKQRSRHLEELTEYLKIPSVSTLAEHKADVQRAAEWTAAKLRSAGLEEVVVNATPGHPIVTGHTPLLKGAPTVLVYGHYDVQPVEPLAAWKTPPFQPTVKAGKIYGRGTADDKGQIFIHLAVLEAFHSVRGGFPVNIKVLFEGEEEIGSPNLLPFIRRNAKRLACDVVLVSDTHMIGIRTPSITVGLRGMACLEFSVRTSAGDQHSGTFGGGIANPCQVIAEILTACKDARTGKVKIPGFYDDVRRMTNSERENLARIPFDEQAYLDETGASALYGEKGFTTTERTGARPTFELNGLWGGYTGPGIKTVLPAEAHAKVSMRLVPFQDPDKIGAAAKAFIESLAPPHARVSVKLEQNKGFPSFVDPNFPAMRAAADAITKVFGKEPLYALEGGSIPIVAEFKRILGRDTILLGFGLPDDNLHAPNEKLDLRMLDKGIKTVAQLYDNLAAQ